MNQWLVRIDRMYRRLARAFPHEFRAVCGDGLERLGADVIPLVWREQGFMGVARCFADLGFRLPLEYISTWTGRLKEEFTMTDDVFEGTWKANNEKSQWDPNYTPEQACMLGQVFSVPKMPKMPDPNQQQGSPATMELLSALSPIVKAKDEFTFDFRLLTPDRSPAFQKAGKVKTSSYGEDVLSQPIKDASDGILAKFPSP